MTIRFQCGACSQPIEVDDEWAAKTVACPYCRKTITAPAESTIDERRPVPEAAPVGGRPGAPPPPPSFQAHAPAAAAGRNTLAVVAFALGLVAVVCLFGARSVASSHRLEMEELLKISEASGGSISQSMEAQKQFFEDYPDAVNWIMALGVCFLGAAIAWLATVICGVIAVMRPARRGFATAALIIAGLVPIFTCCGGVFRAAA